MKRFASATAAAVKGLLINIAYFLSGFSPRDKNLWVFGSWEGYMYRDNARYLFEYVAADSAHRGRIVWVTHSSKVAEELRKKGYPVALSSTLRGWRLQLRAGVFFVTHARHDVTKFLTRGATVVFLNHALPLKHMGYDVVTDPYYHPTRLKRSFFMLVDPYWNLNFDWLLAASSQTSHIVSSSLHAPQEKIISMGFPRFTPLARTPKLNVRPRHRKILYMPTFRDHDHFSHFDYGFDLTEAERRLVTLDAELLIGLHPFDRSPVPELVKRGGSTRLRLFAPLDVNECLPEMDALVTDFSSVMFDYLLLDRPMAFTQFDYEDFIANQRGTYFQYNEVTPGPKVRDWPQLWSALEECLNGNDAPWHERRTEVRSRLFHTDYSDVNERIIAHVEKICR